MDPLTPIQLEVITYIEQYWYQKESFPSVDGLRGRFPGFNIEENLKHETFRLALYNRGIEAPVGLNNEGKFPDELSTEQLAAINSILNFEDKRSRAAKLKELGINPSQWTGWMKNPVFKNFLQEMSAVNLNDSVHIAHEGLMKSVDKGDTNAIKFYMELTGRHTQGDVNQQNIKVVLARVIESIQRHVQDPHLLRAIAADFEVIMSGGVVDTNSVKELERTI